MNRLLMLALSFTFLVSPAMAQVSTQGSNGAGCCLLQAPSSDVIVDVDHLPAKVELTLGQSVVFVQKEPTSAARFNTLHSFDAGANGKAPDPLDALNTAAVIRKGFRVLAVYEAKNEGKGTLFVFKPASNPAKKKAIPFIVQSVAAPSGVEGGVSAGPTLPVPAPGQKDTRPVAGAVITVTDSNGKEIARTTADAKGQFKLALAPGKYTVTARFPNQKSAFPMPRSVEVTVPKQGYEKLDLQLDTGIRTPPAPPKDDSEMNFEIEHKLRSGADEI